MTYDLEQLTLIARAFSDPIRLQIMDLIAKAGAETAVPSCCTKGMCVCDIQEALDMKQSKVSYHLKELKKAGLLHERKVGKWHYYAVNQDTIERFCRELNNRFFLNSLHTEATVE
ncbi:ArsR family transcriptional regulator [Planifilum fimeticola]|jgi:ArsR family transcriptional regulator, arsenate/arsenite/antimonite-responsive transcriptional repressor|uniref:ArsR family transcriptional regulator n=1 Tax=Planifilum fimeticola TaxID=201975 RepID=A0A2T0LAK3_9BACL|nr:metalloregulator ArsR/SmtB family transcription factor [Planifilum fimeticola]PRX38847.1 ArsR family transcriptional regulator [Planifilum fimeticola]